MDGTLVLITLLSLGTTGGVLLYAARLIRRRARALERAGRGARRGDRARASDAAARRHARRPTRRAHRAKPRASRNRPLAHRGCAAARAEARAGGPVAARRDVRCRPGCAGRRHVREPGRIVGEPLADSGDWCRDRGARSGDDLHRERTARRPPVGHRCCGVRRHAARARVARARARGRHADRIGRGAQPVCGDRAQASRGRRLPVRSHGIVRRERPCAARLPGARGRSRITVRRHRAPGAARPPATA